MSMHWEQSASGLQVEDFDMEVEDEDYDIQKPHIQSNENEEHMKNLAINATLILELQMINKFVSNNYRSEGIGMQRSKDYLLGVSTKSTKIFA